MKTVNPQMLLHSGFQHWLDEFVTPGGNLPQAAPLDPFATSMRNCGRATPWLANVRDAAPISSKDPAQAVTDMRNAGWVSGSLPNVVLTDLGNAILDEWTMLGVLNEDPRFEVVRAGALIRNAVELGLDQYREMVTFWDGLVSFQPPSYWWHDLHTLYLPSFLNGTDSEGFNPLTLILKINGSLGPPQEWESLATDPTFAGAAQVQRILVRVNNFRPGGRRRFQQAMQAYLLAYSAPITFQQVVSGWEIS